MTYLDQLSDELVRVGIRGRQRARILAEAADHIAEGDAEEFGDPKELAQLFADELATQATRRSAYVAFAALGLAGAGFAVGWRFLILNGTADITSAAFLPLGLVAAFCLIACPQISFAAGLLSLLRARRLRKLRAAPAAELALLARRTNTALAFGAASLLAFAVYAVDYHAAFSRWQVLAAGWRRSAHAPARRRRDRVPSRSLRPLGCPRRSGDMFDDLPFACRAGRGSCASR